MFRRPIGQNQGIAHPLARCWMELEAANLMVMKAADLYDRGLDCGAEANAAKYLAGEAAFHACETAVMTHGGMGYSQGISRRALSARGDDPAHRADHAAHDPQFHRGEGARLAEVILEEQSRCPTMIIFAQDWLRSSLPVV